MRISDWSSDVCSSDLTGRRLQPGEARLECWQRMIQYGFRRPVARDAPDRPWLIEHEQFAPSHHEYLPADLVRRRRHQCHREVGDLVGAHEILDALDANARRSEEHTSELQSLMRISYAVFCLKKKNQ